MNSKLWIKKALSTCSMVAVIATYSMVALAAEGKASGELTINGVNAVIVNGESAKSGRTIFTSSTIATPEGTTAMLNLGKAGQISVAPSSTLSISFDNNTVSVDLTSGAMTVLAAAQTVAVNAGGKSFTVAAGETVTSAGKKDDDDNDDKGTAWWIWALVFGGAAVGIVIAATQGTDTQLGGGGTVVSPNR